VRKQSEHKALLISFYMKEEASLGRRSGLHWRLTHGSKEMSWPFPPTIRWPSTGGVHPHKKSSIYTSSLYPPNCLANKVPAGSIEGCPLSRSVPAKSSDVRAVVYRSTTWHEIWYWTSGSGTGQSIDTCWF
jgi:hypothetical protein